MKYHIILLVGARLFIDILISIHSQSMFA
jgi:hypothetical protein